MTFFLSASSIEFRKNRREPPSSKYRVNDEASASLKGSCGPAVITSDLRLNEPRYVKLPDIMKAKKKPLETIEPSALGVSPVERLKAVKFDPPSQRSKGVMVKDVGELFTALRGKGLV
mgnify:CR=1 FL=1